MNLDYLQDADEFTMDLSETSSGEVVLTIIWQEYNAQLDLTFDSYKDALRWIYISGQLSKW